jgi:hypothetical protein
MRRAVVAPMPTEGQLHARRKLQPGHRAGHLLVHRHTHLVRGIVDGRGEQVFQHLAVFLQQGRIDLHAHRLVLAVQRHLHHAAAGFTGGRDLRHLRLRLLQVLLHGLGLLQQVADVASHGCQFSSV